MKYTKLFNNNSEYTEYVGSNSFIAPNVSYCVQDEEVHTTSATSQCVSSTTYQLIGTPKYPSVVGANDTSFDLEFYCKVVHINAYCVEVFETEHNVENIAISINTSEEPRTVSGSITYHGITIEYSLQQEGSKITTNDYLTFVATESGTFKFSGNSINYSLNNGSTWTELASNTDSPTVSAGSKILWKATGLTPTSSNGIGRFSSTNNFTVEGNVMSLLYGDEYKEQTSLSGKSYAFYGLFSACTTITSAENLILPTTTLEDACYRYMFYNCKSLTTAPQLPATRLANNCYYGMFNGCTSLTTAPELPATTLTERCYQDMFKNCSGLTTAPMLSSTTLANYCYNSMFNGCGNLVTVQSVLPATTLASHCYQYMFCLCKKLVNVPSLPATTLTNNCYEGMFQNCKSLTTAPTLSATALANYSYKNMFSGCTSLSSITCFATDISATDCTTNWVGGVASSGTFVKNSLMTSWTNGVNGIPSNWTVFDEEMLYSPTISCDLNNSVTITSLTPNANIYYRFNESGSYSAYTTAIVITADTIVEAYSEKNGNTSSTVSQTCTYLSTVPIEYSNRSLDSWTYTNDSINVTVPYSVNAIDGHSSHYKTDGDNPKLPFKFETDFVLREEEPTYLWFEHADQSADIYIDDTLVETHYGGYNAFFSDVSNYVHSGTNKVSVALRNKIRNDLAPCAGDFNFNATLGYVKLFTSPYMPNKEYGYDGFHITSSFEYTTTANTTASAATITVKTSIPTGATVNFILKSGSTNIYSATSASTGAEMTFVTPSLTGTNLHLWNGTSDPFLYDVTIEIYHGQDLYHRYTRPYGLRFYEYVINDTVKYGTVGNPYTGFLLNGQPYLLRGVCMHSDKANKANALTSADIAADFSVIQELGCNFIRLAHYPHPKEVYDTCDRLGIVVQTEVPWVNQSSSGQPEDYYTRLEGQYDDMVKQHYNHPCILFWGLANEITPSATAFTKSKIEQYTTQIKALDGERLVGFVMSHSYNSPTAFDTPNVDWFGCNIYVGWYVDKTSNNPTSQLNTRVNNFITNANKPFAFSEYGCGGTQRCHSDDPQTTTTKGTNQPRHDIEYEMWIHEGHIAAIRNFPQLLFTAQWQLFDIAMYNRQEGYTICLDGENASTDDNLKYLNNKGLVERDHITKKDVFYIYKAEWNPQKFVHICGKDYTKKTSRTIKCYTNDDSLTLYVNNASVETISATNHIVTFTSRSFNSGDIIRVDGNTNNVTDTFTFE